MDVLPFEAGDASEAVTSKIEKKSTESRNQSEIHKQWSMIQK